MINNHRKRDSIDSFSMHIHVAFKFDDSTRLHSRGRYTFEMRYRSGTIIITCLKQFLKWCNRNMVVVAAGHRRIELDTIFFIISAKSPTWRRREEGGGDENGDSLSIRPDRLLSEKLSEWARANTLLLCILFTVHCETVIGWKLCSRLDTFLNRWVFNNVNYERSVEKISNIAILSEHKTLQLQSIPVFLYIYLQTELFFAQNNKSSLTPQMNVMRWCRRVSYITWKSSKISFSYTIYILNVNVKWLVY